VAGEKPSPVVPTATRLALALGVYEELC